MAKHIAPPATAEQIMQALGVTQEDREIIDRVLREVDEEEEVALNLRPSKRDHPIDGVPNGMARPPYGGPEEDDSSKPKKGPKS